MPRLNGQALLKGERQRRTLVIILSFLLVAGTGIAGLQVYSRSMAASATARTAQEADLSLSDLKEVNLFASIDKQTSIGRSYVLTQYDRSIYTNVFDAQSKGDWSRANALLKRVHDPILVGHVLYDRYIHAKEYKTSYAELRDWMVKYGDHPDAYKVYQLAQKRRNNDPSNLPTPQIAKKLLGTLELSWFEKETTTAPKGNVPRGRVAADVRQLMGEIKKRLSNEQVTYAYNLLGKSHASRMLTNVEYDSLLGEIASGYYYSGKFDAALRVANQAIKRSDKSVPIAHWIAGLASWQNENYKQAAQNFAAINDSYSHNPWMLSAAAFWAARSYERIGEDGLQNDWLQEAASYPRTFYGLIAQSAIGRDADFSWESPTLSESLVDALQKTPAGKRGLALLDIEQNTLAEKELRQVHPNGNQRLEKALVAVADHFKLANLSLSLGNAVNQPNGKLYDAALYPVVPWKGDAKTGIDPALVNALIRQESKFDPNAKNGSSGAKGLMQIMPRTARFISAGTKEADHLHDPETNIALGQRYVRYLLNMNGVGNNLIYMTAAYNAGPGNLDHWKKTVSYKDDPFLFIETLPMSETRAFVERVMANYWIYAQQLDQETETLQAMTDEEWPTYTPQPSDIKLAAY